MTKMTICRSKNLFQAAGLIGVALASPVFSAVNAQNAPTTPTPTKPGTTIFSESGPGRNTSTLSPEGIVRGSLPAVRPGEYEVAPIVAPLKGLPGVAKIAGARDRAAVPLKESGRMYLLHDQVYLSGSGHKAGQRYLTYAPGPAISGVGLILIPTGILLVESAQPGVLAEARIERVFAEIKDEQQMVPLTYPVTLPEGNTIPVYVGMRAKVVWAVNNPVLPSLQHYVVFNVGEKQGVKPGDQFTIMDETNKGTPATPTAPVDVAVVKIVRVTPYGSSGIIIDNDQPLVKEGMFARMTAKAQQ